MDRISDSIDLLVGQDSPDSPHANVNPALQGVDSETSSGHASPTSNDQPPSTAPEPRVPPIPEAPTPEAPTADLNTSQTPTPRLNTPEMISPEPTTTHNDTVDTNCQETSEQDDEYEGSSSKVGDGGSDSFSNPPPPAQFMSHSRGASQASCEASMGRLSGRENSHSRGASTDGSLMDGYTSSIIDSRRGTYSEAGTLPIGSTIIEENGWDREADEKKLSPVESEVKYVDKFLSSCNCCKSLLGSNHQLPEHPTVPELIRYSLTCPPHGWVGEWLLWVVMSLAAWGCLVSILGATALPGGNIFSLMVLYAAALAGAAGMGHVGLPPLLGSLVVGILLSSVPGINTVGHSVDVHWSSTLRSCALVIILIRAGLGLDPVALRKLNCVVLRLAFLPCLVETISAAVVSHFVLALPWLWSFMLGFIVAAVSPAVVVPCLLQLGEEGYGVEEGIPTLVIAAASLDDVLAITGFSVMLTLTFSKGSLYWTISKGPVEIVLGLLYGLVFGVLCWYLPHKKKKYRPIYKFIIMFVLGSLAMFGSQKVNLESSGPIGVLSLAFVAGLGWRRPENMDSEVGNYYRQVWQLIQPMLFVLIGAEIDLGTLEVSTIGWGLITLAVCLSLRVATSFLVVAGGNFSVWERLFIAIAWLPKATVQAAIGSEALDYVRQYNGSDENIARGLQVVTIAVMVILVTAPAGAAAIKLTAPRFLKRKAPSTASSNDPESSV
ncbi:hypothetical protein Pcinc_017629 [Petrolisthes cinctipes]|uniref:Cation/H+ exchanger transmembrane domain-containing protein n=1 Tax=Petrolisthes cinctipes TaxID=88211 RepID=A0AAE1K0S3_PETCI|nr:hypothetical protein Pcinc_033736 [Petrolisthes cinctipes]KAK3877667.1 hypothetical protein Pcinc_017629 [Petrolisthes cinctipes]